MLLERFFVGFASVISPLILTCRYVGSCISNARTISLGGYILQCFCNRIYTVSPFYRIQNYCIDFLAIPILHLGSFGCRIRQIERVILHEIQDSLLVDCGKHFATQSVNLFNTLILKVVRNRITVCHSILDHVDTICICVSHPLGKVIERCLGLFVKKQQSLLFGYQLFTFKTF